MSTCVCKTVFTEKFECAKVIGVLQTKTNRIHHGCPVEIGKSQPEGPPVPVGNEARGYIFEKSYSGFSAHMSYGYIIWEYANYDSTVSFLIYT